jgi:hypothetical protein
MYTADAKRKETANERRMNYMKKIITVNTLMQVGLVSFTTLGFLLSSLKLPQYGLLGNLAGQAFWLYTSYQAWRKANQIGMFIVTILITSILIYGVLNYWLFSQT